MSDAPTLGEWYQVTGRRGVYRVTAIHPDHVEVYGGDVAGLGRRQFRAVTPDRLRPLTRAQAASLGLNR